MKREIHCKECRRKLVGMPSYPGEYEKVVRGALKGNALCDYCNKRLVRGDEAYAVSQFYEGGYYQWEDEYLEAK